MEHADMLERPESKPSEAVGTANVEMNEEDATSDIFWLAAREAREAQCTSTRAAWANEVKAMAIQLSAARSRLNAFSPVSALPDEVLARIFELLASVFPIRARHRRWGWVGVTHVSRRFRAAAVGHALLWATLSVDGQTPWDLFLSRAREAPLHIHGTIATPGQSHYYASRTLQVIKRVRTIRVEDIPPITGRDWQNILRTEAPELQSLDLTIPSTDESEHDTHDPSNDELGSMIMDKSFLTHDAPKLRKLGLSGVEIQWSLDTPIALTSLALDGFGTATQFFLQDVLRNLESLPSLEHLALSNILRGGPTSHVIKTRVGVTHLRSLLLAELDGRCLNLWSSLDLPPTCSVRIEMEGLEVPGAAVWKDMMINRANSQHTTYRRVRFEYPDFVSDFEPRDGLQVTLYTTGDVEDAEPGSLSLDGTSHVDARPRLTFLFNLEIFEGELELFYDLFELSSTNWEGVTFSNVHALDPEQMLLNMRCVSSLLGHFGTFEVMEVHGRSSNLSAFDYSQLEQAFFTCLLDELLPRSAPSPATGPCVVRFFPKIHTLSLSRAHMEEVFFYNQRERLYDAVSEALRCRYFADAPIHTIKLYKTKTRDAWIEMWENYVDEVQHNTCDDSVASCSDDDDDSDSDGTSSFEGSGETSEDSEAEWVDDENDLEDEETV
ncbi:unnamed protein product [Peniophora sp. CBMAI 1063]|nr:unnamed protein product [Peniophora sp. CBMAI 1063]